MSPEDDPPPTATARSIRLVTVALVCASLPAVIGCGLLEALRTADPGSGLRPAGLAGGILAEAYLAMPLVAVSGVVLYLVPGALLALLVARPRTLGAWVLHAFGASLVLGAAWSTLRSTVLVDLPARTALLVGWSAAIAVLAWLVSRRAGGTGDVGLPYEGRTDARRLAATLTALLVFVSLLAPKILWEDFNSDGVESFEFGRSLDHSLLPDWHVSGGAFGWYHNFVLFAFPNHWFISLFGPVEAAVRLPYFLYLGVLFFGIVALVERAPGGRLGGGEVFVLWLSLASYTVVQAFDTNYEPFYGDIAEPAATDTLAVVCFVALCHCLWSGRRAGAWMFGIMTHLAAPGGLLMLLALLVATAWAARSVRTADVRRLALLACVCVGIAVVHDIGFAASNPEAGNQFSSKNLLRRLFPPTPFAFHRISALVFPCGVLPGLWLLLRHRGDDVRRVLAGTSLVYFAVIYGQAWVAVHQFTPAMVLPVVVFWRSYLAAPSGRRRWLLPTAGVLAVVSLVLSLPQHSKLHRATRELGIATDFRVGDYGDGYPSAARAAGTLWELFEEDYRLEYPEQPWGTDEFAWLYYALQPKPDRRFVNYVVTAEGAEAPFGAELVGTRNGASVYVRNTDRWKRDRELDWPKVVTSPLYERMPRRTQAFFREFARAQQAKERSREE